MSDQPPVHPGRQPGYPAPQPGYPAPQQPAYQAQQPVPAQQPAYQAPYAYPPGTSIPVDGSVHADIQHLLQTKPKSLAQVDAFVAQRFPAWQVYPVKVGRWRLKLYGSGLSGNIDGLDNDPISMIILVAVSIWALIFLVVRITVAPGKWIKAPDVVQILDPATGRPIAEHLVVWRSTTADPATLDGSSTLIFLGDPRVCGLVGLTTPQGQVYIGGNAFNRQGRWSVKRSKWTPQYIEQNAARLMNTPYQEYDSRRSGPWLQDSPEQPQGGRTRWSKLKR
jgi:hypothetical protein